MPDSSPAVRVLLLEDEVADCALISDTLERDGITVAGTFDHLRDLLVALGGQDGPDLIITDLNLPDSEGLYTLAAIKAAHPDLRIVVCTGDLLAAEAAAVLGADHVVLKDDLLTDLAAAVAADAQPGSVATAAAGGGFTHADVALLVVAKYDSVLLANAAAHDLVGRNAIAGECVTMLFVADDRMEVAAFLTECQAAAGQRVWTNARLQRVDDPIDCTITGRFDREAGLVHLTVTTNR